MGNEKREIIRTICIKNELDVMEENTCIDNIDMLIKIPSKISWQ